MKLLDRYIIKKYLGTFFYSVMLISMVAVVINVSENIGKFLDNNVGLGEIAFDYYLNFIPYINGLLWPIFALLAVIFFSSRMARDSETIAILSAGVSFYRILVPYLIAASIIAAMLWYGNHYLIPRSSIPKNEFESKYFYVAATKSLGTNIHSYLNPNEKVYVRYYRTKDTSGQVFRLERFKGDKLSYLIKASRIRIKELPNTWTLFDYEKRHINDMDEDILVAKGESMDTILNITPNDFLKETKLLENTTSPELRSYVKSERERGLGTAQHIMVELHRRSADPVTILILTIIGAAIASRKVRGGLGFHLATGVILGSLFVVVSKFSITIASNLSINAAFGMWLPNLLFGICAIVLVLKAQK